ncbi:MAG TPA: EAL domain-containing protein [Actinotalea sp.]|jgi:EAL domain-containing protein (putative c-di-GMP-specific phosphodiesterase class I)
MDAVTRRSAASRRGRWRRSGWLRRGLFETGSGPAIGLITVALVVVALLTFVLAGRGTAIFHAFYLPIVLAANRFRWRGAIATAVLAGLFSGPLRPVSEAAGPAQQTWAWVLRAVVFLLVGLLVAWLSRESTTSFATAIRERGNAGALRDAVKRGVLQAHYQPIVDLGSGDLIGFEALCRWTHSTHGPIPPGEFIPLAERTGVVVPLGRDMLGRATRQAAAWHASGHPHLMVTVNVSAEQLIRSDLLDDVGDALRSTGLPPSALCLEITESAVIRDPVAAMANVRAAHDLGVLVALDDFGTGHSSFAYLRDFPIDIIKIDKSFVDDVDTDPQVSALVVAVIELAHALGAITIAEGIERASQHDTLRRLACDWGQGYLLGRPAPAEDAVLGADAWDQVDRPV